MENVKDITSAILSAFENIREHPNKLGKNTFALRRKWYKYIAGKITPKDCTWIDNNKENIFSTKCGKTFQVTNESTLRENKFKHCPFCGGKIKTTMDI